MTRDADITEEEIRAEMTPRDFLMDERLLRIAVALERIADVLDRPGEWVVA